MNSWNKIVVLIVAGFVLATPLFSSAQSSKNLAENEKLDGKIKSIEFQRTYFIFKRQNVAMAPQLLGIDRFDEKGDLSKRRLLEMESSEPPSIG